MPTATISSKGWIVIPAEYRRKYGLEEGQRVQIVDYGGVLSSVLSMPDPIEGAWGLLKGGPSLTRALTEERRRDADHEDRQVERLRSR